jgi:amino acid adenylation domain-containing protein
MTKTDHLATPSLDANGRYSSSIANQSTGIAHDVPRAADYSLHALDAFNPKVQPLVDECLHDIFHERALTHPNRPAVSSWNGEFTYGQLDDLSSRLAHYLLNLKVQMAEYIPLCFEKSCWYPVALLGVLKAGGSFVPLDPSHPIQRLEEIYRAVQGRVVIATKATADKVRGFGDKIILIDDDCEPNWMSSSTADYTPKDISSSNVAYAIFTSGTSGTPKGVVIEHRSLSTSVLANTAALNIHPMTRVLQFAAHAFDASLLDIFGALLADGCVCIPSEKDRKGNLAGACRDFQATWAFLTPSITRVLDPKVFPTLETLVIGGEALKSDDIEKWLPYVECIAGYGPTECTIGCMALRAEKGTVDPSNLGRGTAVNCWVVNPNDPEQPSVPGTVGELLLEGPLVARGYINDSQSTAQAFIERPLWHRELRQQGYRMYRTGDLVAFDEHKGILRYIGRRDVQVKLHGQRLDAGEVEHHIRSFLPGTVNVVVDIVQIEAPALHPILVAFILLRGEVSRCQSLGSDWLGNSSPAFRAQIHKLKGRLRDVVPDYMIPSAFLPLVSMPLTNNGKSDRRRLRGLAAKMTRDDLYQYSDQVTVPKMEPTKPMEKMMQLLWARILAVQPNNIGMHDSFFALGGSSIGALTLAALARKAGLELEIGDLYDHPTLEDMVSRLRPIQDTTTGACTMKPFCMLPDKTYRTPLMKLIMQQCGLKGEVDIEDIYPCTALQEGIISLTVKRPGAYTGSFQYELPMQIDVCQLQSAWRCVVEANPILRTRFVQAQDGTIYQAVIHGTIPLIETSENRPSASKSPPPWEFGQSLVSAQFNRPSSGSRSSFLILKIHHSLSDGWGLPLLLGQLEAAYKGESLTPRPFGPFVEYIQRTSRGHEVYWRECFAGLQSTCFPALPSPTYVPSPTSRFVVHVPLQKVIGGDFSIADRLKLSWAIVLSLYTDSPEPLFGLTVSGRGAPVLGVEDMTGPTICTIPMRLRLGADITVAEALQQALQYCISAIPHEQIGLQRLRRLGPELATACNFQSHLVVQPELVSSQTMFAKKTDLSAVGAFSSYAINLICQPLSDAVEVEVTFDPRVVPDTQMRRMMNLYKHMLGRLMTVAGGTLLSELDITSADDWSDLERWNRRLPETVRSCAHDMIREKCLSQPDAPAVCAWDGSFTYEQVDQMSSDFASYLAREGVAPGVFVPLYFEKSRWTIIAMLAVSKAGGAFILLDDSHPLQRLRGICKDAKASFVITSEKNAFGAVDITSRYILLGNHHRSWTAEIEVSTAPRAFVGSSDALYAVFTSGSSGKPKGAVISHEAWCTSAKANAIGLAIHPRSRVLQFAAYAFDISIADHLLTLVAGGCICVPSAEDRESNLVGFIKSVKANWACLTPSVARIIQPQEVKCLKTLVLAGEPIAPEDIVMWSPSVHLLNLYGPAECAILTTLNQNVNNPSDSNDVGLPTSAVCWVVDPRNNARLAPIGTVGELLVESPIVGYGYLNDPARTAETFISPKNHPDWLKQFRRNGSARLYCTGDLVQYNAENGTLRFMGRRDTQIKLRGQRIELSEVEHHLRQCFPSAQEVVAEVVILPNTHCRPVLMGFIQSDDATLKTCDARFKDQVSAALRPLYEYLPKYMVPTTFIAVQDLPFSKSRKLDRQALRAMASGLPQGEYLDSPSVAIRAPSTPVENILHALFAEVMRVPVADFGVDHDFFGLGGDSVVAMSLVARARERGMSFTVTDLFANPSIFALARLVEMNL